MTRERFDAIRRKDDKNIFFFENFMGQNMTLLHLTATVFSRCMFVDTVFDKSHFCGCVFQGCTFMGCNFSGAVFATQNVFMNCNFNLCDMKDAVGLQRVIFVNDSNEEGIIGAENLPINCPSTGGFIGWKKCRVFNSEYHPDAYERDVIVKLYIPARAKRTTGLNASHKCRASEAKVLGFYDEYGKPLNLKETSQVCSSYNRDFIYRIGETVKTMHAFDEKRVTCTSGIHFFLDFKAAVEYMLI